MVLVEKWPDETTREFLCQRTVQDSDKVMRGEACVALGMMHSGFGRILFTQDVDGVPPYLDPLKPISRQQIDRAARMIGLRTEDIDATVSDLSTHLGWDLKVGAHPG